MDLRRIAASTPSVTDVITWLDARVSDAWEGFFGTLWFRVKAFFLGVECRGRVSVWGPVILRRAPRSTIVIGKDVCIVSSSKRALFTAIKSPTWLRTSSFGARIEIGDGVGMSGTSILARSTSVTIGKGVMIGPNVTIADSDAHVMWPPEARHTYRGTEHDRAVRIEDNVWLGGGCTVLKGVTIGENAVIGAMSLVTSDVPANCLAAGVPARVIRDLSQERGE